MGSIERVMGAAAAAGLPIEVQAHGGIDPHGRGSCAQCGSPSTRSSSRWCSKAAPAAGSICFCLSGANQLDLAKAAALAGEALRRADPRKVREATGFAIGGVAPIGHLGPIRPSPTGAARPSIASGRLPEPMTRCLPPIRRRWLRQLPRRSPRSQSDNARRRAKLGADGLQQHGLGGTDNDEGARKRHHPERDRVFRQDLEHPRAGLFPQGA